MKREWVKGPRKMTGTALPYNTPPWSDLVLTFEGQSQSTKRSIAFLPPTEKGKPKRLHHKMTILLSRQSCTASFSKRNASYQNTNRSASSEPWSHEHEGSNIKYSCRKLSRKSCISSDIEHLPLTVSLHLRVTEVQILHVSHDAVRNIC